MPRTRVEVLDVAYDEEKEKLDTKEAIIAVKDIELEHMTKCVIDLQDFVRKRGIKPWCNMEKVVDVLSRIPMRLKPSVSHAYRVTMTLLDQAREFGEPFKWNPENVPIDKRPRLPDPSTLEALRIFGDAKAGFGTCPKVLEERLHELGLTL